MASSTGKFTVGRDSQVTFIGPLGMVSLSKVTGFTAKQRVSVVNVKPLNEPPLEAHIPQGWDVTMTLERATDAADALFSQIEAGFWNGSTLEPGTVFQAITEIDGTTTTYQYTNFVCHLSDAGDYASDKSVKQTITGYASTRTRY